MKKPVELSKLEYFAAHTHIPWEVAVNVTRKLGEVDTMENIMLNRAALRISEASKLVKQLAEEDTSDE